MIRLDSEPRWRETAKGDAKGTELLNAWTFEPLNIPSLAANVSGDDDTPMPAADTNLPGGIYCRQCGYDLRGQGDSHRCPECGRDFDPADGNTFLARPPRGAGWRWAKRAAVGLRVAGFLLAMGWCWLYWGWKNEQAAMARVGRFAVLLEPLGGEKLKGHLGSAGWVLDRVSRVHEMRFGGKPITVSDFVYPRIQKSLNIAGSNDRRFSAPDLVHFKEFKWLEELSLDRLTDADSIHLKDLNGLRLLDLANTEITDAGLVHLKGLKQLQWLDLRYTRITDAGLAHLKELDNLQWLLLGGTQVTDAGVVHLKELKGIRALDLYGTKVTPEGVEKLRAARPGVKIR